LRRYGLPASDAEDLAQEVFYVIWRRRAHYDPDRPLRPWIGGIIFRVVQQHRRLRAREVLADELDALDEAPGPDEQLASAHARRLVLRALAALPVKQRAVLVMHDLDGTSMREIAGALAVPIFTLYSQLHAGRRSFAREVRRAQLHASLAADLRRRDPAELLARERALPPAPARARERSRQRLKALLPLPGTEELGAPGSPQASPDLAPQVASLGRAQRSSAPPRSGALGWVGGALVASAALFAVIVLWGPAADSHELAPAGAPATAADPPAAPARSLPAVLKRALAAPRIALSVPPIHPPGPPALLRGLLAYWRFDDGPGSGLARDLSGGGSDCVLRRLDRDAAWAEGAVSGALALDGRGWLECPHTDQIDRLGTELTLAAWVKRGPRQPRYRVVVARQMARTRLDDFFLGFTNGDLVFASHLLGARLEHPLPADAEAWFHIAATRRDDGLTRLYLDGVEVARHQGARASLAGSDNPLVIGASFNDQQGRRAEARFGGAIDELLIYHRALAPEEIQTLVAKRAPPVTAPASPAAPLPVRAPIPPQTSP
jgi:RNA polymerase sigma-70 factor, ECF subfamily